MELSPPEVASGGGGEPAGPSGETGAALVAAQGVAAPVLPTVLEHPHQGHVSLDRLPAGSSQDASEIVTNLLTGEQVVLPPGLAITTHMTFGDANRGNAHANARVRRW